MPPRNARPCSEWPCPNLTPCPIHTRSSDRARNDRRKRKTAIYNSRRWKLARKTKLELEPWCQWPGCNEPSLDVDHRDGLDVILDENRDPFDLEELDAYCHAHHSAKTIQTEGVPIADQGRGGAGRQGRGVSIAKTEARPPSESGAADGGIPGRVVRRRVRSSS